MSVHRVNDSYYSPEGGESPQGPALPEREQRMGRAWDSKAAEEAPLPQNAMTKRCIVVVPGGPSFHVKREKPSKQEDLDEAPFEDDGRDPVDAPEKPPVQSEPVKAPEGGLDFEALENARRSRELAGFKPEKREEKFPAQDEDPHVARPRRKRVKVEDGGQAVPTRRKKASQPVAPQPIPKFKQPRKPQSAKQADVLPPPSREMVQAKLRRAQAQNRGFDPLSVFKDIFPSTCVEAAGAGVLGVGISSYEYMLRGSVAGSKKLSEEALLLLMGSFVAKFIAGNLTPESMKRALNGSMNMMAAGASSFFLKEAVVGNACKQINHMLRTMLLGWGPNGESWGYDCRGTPSWIDPFKVGVTSLGNQVGGGEVANSLIHTSHYLLGMMMIIMLQTLAHNNRNHYQNLSNYLNGVALTEIVHRVNMVTRTYMQSITYCNEVQGQGDYFGPDSAWGTVAHDYGLPTMAMAVAFVAIPALLKMGLIYFG
jgi:hypothetical protein